MLNQKTKNLTIAAVLAAASILLSYFEIPVVPGFPFLKLDFAEIPIILCSLVVGPLYAVAAEFVRNAFALMLTGTATLGVGTFANFVLGSSFVVMLYLYVKFTNHKHNAVVGMFAASAVMVLLASALNLVLFIPLYKMVGMYPMQIAPSYFVFAGILPLNLIKWPVLSTLTAVIYKYTKKSVPLKA